LLHITDGYERYLPLDNCSAFPFENYMQTLKLLFKKPDKPLEQVVLRYQKRRHLNNNIKSKKESKLAGPRQRSSLIQNTTI